MKSKLGVLLTMILALLIWAPTTMAAGIVSSGVTAFDATLTNNGVLNYITYNGTDYGNPDYTSFDVALETGTSAMYNSDGDDDPVNTSYPIGNADNFNLGNITTFDNDEDDYMETVFSNPRRLFFIVERGNSGEDTFVFDFGEIQGFDDSGNAVTSKYSFNNTSDWYQTGYTQGSRNLGLLVFDAGQNVDAIRIFNDDYTAGLDGMDPASVSAAVPIPGAVWLLGSGLVGLVAIRRRFKK